MTEPTIIDNPEQDRFEIWVEDQLAGFTLYQVHADRIEFIHTEIHDEFAGHGLGAKLVKAELDIVRDRGLAVYPYCPFVRAYIAKHPEYVDLVPAHVRDHFGLTDKSPSAE